MDLSKIHNPYDFANPVSDEDLFIGRKEELEEIKYYLDHAKTAPRPINIALLGQRASGKTSFLNITEIEAKKRGFCTVRIDLDEDDAKTQLGFFYKLFDGILSAVCESGAYEGKQGKTYDIYLDIVNGYNIPEDKTFCPFLFPLQYAKAMGSGNANVQLSDHNYKSDLVKIHSEINCPIIVLFDEGNVLTNSRVHLEKLRNIFMNIPGFMLVFTGTPDFFPVMNEVFSPIVCQFKKINIGNFKNEEETKDCIRKPLEKMEINPDEIFDFETYGIDVGEIHDLSGGRPYEIQLICHMLFRRVQSKRARKMKLDLSVLEDVRRELETSQDITIRPILTKIRNLRKKQLSALNLLCACDGHATFDQIWAVEYIINGEKSWTKDNLNRELQYFMDKGILESKEGIIKFAGDDFDKIYTKYFAREQRILLNFPDFPLELFWHIRINSFTKKIEGLTAIPEFIVSDIDIDLDGITTKMMSENPDEDVFVETFPLIEGLYNLMLLYKDKQKMAVVQIKISLPWLNVQSFHHATNPDDTKSINICLDETKSLKERANEIGGGGKLLVEKKELPVVPVEVLAQKIERTDNERLRNFLALYHSRKMAEEYVEKSNVQEALFHANLSQRYNSNPDPSVSNNLGYLYMSVGDLDKARNLLEKAVGSYKEPHESALPNYNLGILEAKCGNFKNALEKIKLCIEQTENYSKETWRRKCACLFIPKAINGKLKLEEIKEPDLLEVAREAKNNLELLLTT